MTHSEESSSTFQEIRWQEIRKNLGSSSDDAQVVLWGPEEDIPTALETVEERCRLAFEEVPRESRKSFSDGTTVFERVLPGPDRMYPDTDSAPIPLKDEHVESIRERLPVLVSDRYSQLREWKIPSDTFTYLLSHNLMPLLERIVGELSIEPKFVGTLLGHTLKNIEGRYTPSEEFTYDRVFELLEYLRQEEIDLGLACTMLKEMYQHPRMDFEFVLATIQFKRVPQQDILNRVPNLVQITRRSNSSLEREARIRWIMGEMRKIALGNIPLHRLRDHIEETVSGG